MVLTAIKFGINLLQKVLVLFLAQCSSYAMHYFGPTQLHATLFLTLQQRCIMLGHEYILLLVCSSVCPLQNCSYFLKGCQECLLFLVHALPMLYLSFLVMRCWSCVYIDMHSNSYTHSLSVFHLFTLKTSSLDKMGRHFGNLARIRHVITYSISPFEQKAFPNYFSKGIPNVWRRFRASVFKVAPRKLTISQVVKHFVTYNYTLVVSNNNPLFFFLKLWLWCI